MELLLVAVAVAVLVYVAKSYLFYHETNPYHAENADYAHPFKQRSGGDIYGEVLQSEYGLIAALMAKVAKADGKVCELEAEIIHATLEELAGYFSHRQKALAILHEILEKEEREHDNIELIASEFLNYTQNDPKKRVKIIEFLLNLAFADKTLGEAEEETIGKIAFFFKIPAAQYQQILEEFKAYYSHYESSGQDPYALLGVSKEVSAAELKKVYRNLVKEHHPDIIKGKGGDEAFVEEATVKLQQINEAYERIKEAKGY